MNNMGKFGGFGGGMPNMQQLMKQAQKMQQEVASKQAEVSSKLFEASTGGGAIIVKCTGDKVIKEIKIKKDVVDPDDVEMLEDLILTAVNECLNKAENAMQSSMGSFNIPGLM
jgi:nucleoid-associated protein EbfC